MELLLPRGLIEVQDMFIDRMDGMVGYRRMNSFIGFYLISDNEPNKCSEQHRDKLKVYFRMLDLCRTGKEGEVVTRKRL